MASVATASIGLAVRGKDEPFDRLCWKPSAKGATGGCRRPPERQSEETGPKAVALAINLRFKLALLGRFPDISPSAVRPFV